MVPLHYLSNIIFILFIFLNVKLSSSAIARLQDVSPDEFLWGNHNKSGKTKQISKLLALYDLDSEGHKVFSAPSIKGLNVDDYDDWSSDFCLDAQFPFVYEELPSSVGFQTCQVPKQKAKIGKKSIILLKSKDDDAATQTDSAEHLKKHKGSKTINTKEKPKVHSSSKKKKAAKGQGNDPDDDDDTDLSEDNQDEDGSSDDEDGSFDDEDDFFEDEDDFFEDEDFLILEDDEDNESTNKTTGVVLGIAGSVGLITIAIVAVMFLKTRRSKTLIRPDAFVGEFGSGDLQISPAPFETLVPNQYETWQ